MLALSPSLLIATASGMVGTDRVVDRPGALDHEAIFRDRHHPADPVRTAAFVGHVGYWSHRRGRGSSSWPFGIDADCSALEREAEADGVLHRGAPEIGSIFLQRSNVENRFVRAGIVIWAADIVASAGGDWAYDCLVVEGHGHLSRDNSGEISSRVSFARRARIVLCPSVGDRVISWYDLDGRGKYTQLGPQRRAA
jgi:hypothetical protein